MGNLSNSTNAPQQLAALPATATGEEKQGWGHSLFPTSGKSFWGGVINMIYMFMNITKALHCCGLCVEQKRAASSFPLLLSGPFTTNQGHWHSPGHQAGKSKLTTHRDPLDHCRNQGSLRAVLKCLLHYGAASKLKNKE